MAVNALEPDEFRRGIEAFARNEPRGHIYFEALRQISESWGHPSGMAEGIGVLLHSWHLTFYRFGDFSRPLLEECIERNLRILSQFRGRDIVALSGGDEAQIKHLFNEFLDALKGGSRRSPVAVAKALHLLAPSFFPLWDTDIALAYDSWWAFSEFGDFEYLAFCRKIKGIAEKVRHYECVANPTPDRSLLKMIDEYNYSKFTKN